MSENRDAPLGRVEALERVRTQFAIVAEHCAHLEAASTDRGRRSSLNALIGDARELHDRVADAYEALEFAADEDGIARGVLE